MVCGVCGMWCGICVCIVCVCGMCHVMCVCHICVFKCYVWCMWHGVCVLCACGVVYVVCGMYACGICVVSGVHGVLCVCM